MNLPNGTNFKGMKDHRERLAEDWHHERPEEVIDNYVTSVEVEFPVLKGSQRVDGSWHYVVG